jgi:hypothetical protein
VLNDKSICGLDIKTRSEEEELLGVTEEFDDSQFEKSDVLGETMNLDETALTA